MKAKDEAGRLEALRGLNLLDTPASEAFDQITRLAARLFGTPMAAVSLVDEQRQWFKSRVGLDVAETAREHAFCQHTIRTHDVLVVPDATRDPRFDDNPLVRGQPGIRFYAGAPLVTHDGYAVGSLCVIDDRPRELSEDDRRTLAELASLVMAQIELQQAAGRADQITGLPNQYRYQDDLKVLTKRHAGEDWVGVTIDLAPPEEINDVLRAVGAVQADNLVRLAGNVIAEQLGRDIQVYHVRFTRFAFVMPATDGRDWQTVITHLTDRLHQPVLFNDFPVNFPACAGVVPFRMGDLGAHDIARMALAAVHDARAAEEDWAVYNAETDRAHQRRYRLLSYLPAAVASPDQLHLVYQPRVDVRSGRCVGAEALLRWRHPSLGAISPGEFIPLVERTALTRGITERVMRDALSQSAEWDMRGLDLAVSINITARNLEEPDLTERVERALRHHDLLPDRVEFEFTEGALLHNSGRSMQQLRDLRALGLRIAVDDFGTGYCNFSYLRQLPASVVKLDQSFIRTLPASAADQIIVRAMISMAHDLGYRVVAEGVERREVFELITELGADEAQGYWFSRPIPPDDLVAWLGKRPEDLRQAG